MELCNSTVIRGSINAIDMAGTESVAEKVRGRKRHHWQVSKSQVTEHLMCMATSFDFTLGKGGLGGLHTREGPGQVQHSCRALQGHTRGPRTSWEAVDAVQVREAEGMEGKGQMTEKVE